MKARKWFHLFICPVLLALILSAAVAESAFADDSPPPDATASSGSDEARAAEVQPADPDERTLPLGQRDPGEAATSGDPIWCPVGVAPKPSTGGCSIDYTNLSSLVAGMVPTTNGVIWIKYGVDSGSEVNIDGTGPWSAAKGYSLSLKGGWKGTYGNTGLGGTGQYAYVSVIEDALNIVHWNGSISLSNITVRNVITNAAHPFVSALYINALNSVTLKNVSAINNNGGMLEGVRIETDGAPGKPVMVTGGQFSNNDWDGLMIMSDGPVTLSNVAAVDNHMYGVEVDNSSSSKAPYPVYINGVNVFDRNGNDGLWVVSDGLIRISKVTASHNSGAGVSLTNDVPASNTYPGIQVLGYLTAIQNGYRGLAMNSDGPVTASNLRLELNAWEGLVVDNDSGTLPKPVTITGLNVFYANGHEGLEIHSKGAVTLQNVTATHNGAGTDNSGAYIVNRITSTVQQNVTLAGNNVFARNGGRGLRIESYGTVTLNNLTAENNGRGIAGGVGDGVYVLNDNGTAARPVYVNGLNAFSYNEANGIYIESAGLIRLSKVTAYWNGATGVSLDNTAASAVQPVLITGYITLTDNRGRGLLVESHGPVTLYNATAIANGYGALTDGIFVGNIAPAQPGVTFIGPVYVYDNSSAGVYILTLGAVSMANVTASDNGTGNGSSNVYISNYGGTLPKPVTIGGVNVFNDGGAYGLRIQSSGPVTVSKVTALRNGAAGVDIDNHYNYNGVKQATGKVSILGYGIFEDNVDEGLYVSSHGPIAATNLSAISNGNDGAHLLTSSALGNPGVLLSGTNTFSRNGDAGTESGLEIQADGAITISNVTANYNYYDAVYLTNIANWVAPTVYNITLLGFGDFGYSTVNDGLHVLASGNVLLNRVTANWNPDDGIHVEANGHNLKLICSSATLNLNGIYISNVNTLTLQGWVAAGNTNDELGTATTTIRSACP